MKRNASGYTRADLGGCGWDAFVVAAEVPA